MRKSDLMRWTSTVNSESGLSLSAGGGTSPEWTRISVCRIGELGCNVDEVRRIYHLTNAQQKLCKRPRKSMNFSSKLDQDLSQLSEPYRLGSILLIDGLPSPHSVPLYSSTLGIQVQIPWSKNAPIHADYMPSFLVLVVVRMSLKDKGTVVGLIEAVPSFLFAWASNCELLIESYLLPSQLCYSREPWVVCYPTFFIYRFFEFGLGLHSSPCTGCNMILFGVFAEWWA